MDSFWMYLWASSSLMLRDSMRAHLALFTRRISSIFSSRVMVFFRMPRSLSRTLHMESRSCLKTDLSIGLLVTRTPWADITDLISSYMSLLTSRRATRSLSIQISTASFLPNSSGRGALMMTRS